VETCAFVLGATANVLDSDAFTSLVEQLLANGGAQVDVRFVAGSARDHTRSRRTDNRFGDIEPDLETTRSDAGANGRDEPAAAELRQSRADDAGHDPAPAGMDGGDVPAVRVGNEDGHAIRDPYPDGDPARRCARKEGIGLEVRVGRSRVDRARSVNLLGLYDVRDMQVSEERRAFRLALRKGVREAGGFQRDCSADGHHPS
jgi:hypothetical protein